jgi:membrane-associated phospholipid phosphatase
MASSLPRGPGSTIRWSTALEVLLGAGLVGLAATAGLFFMHRPWPSDVDILGLRLLPADYAAGWAHDVTRLGSLPTLLVGALVLLVVGLLRDWVRGIACAAGPLLAALVVQDAAKPLVDRHLSTVSGSSYPSGTVTVVTALSTAAVLVVPPLLRGLTVLIAVMAVAAACAAVVVLRWHFPTDALGGVCVGAGLVLLLDGLLHVARALWQGARVRLAAQT